MDTPSVDACSRVFTTSNGCTIRAVVTAPHVAAAVWAIHGSGPFDAGGFVESKVELEPIDEDSAGFIIIVVVFAVGGDLVDTNGVEVIFV